MLKILNLGLNTQIVYYCLLLLILFWTFAHFGNKKTIQRPSLGIYLFTTILILLSFLLIFNFLSFPALERIIIPINGILSDIGVIVAISGILFVGWARIVLGGNWSGSTLAIKENHELITSGPYSIVRHPMYTGTLFILLGIAFTVGNIQSFLAVIMCLIAYLIRIYIEEKILRQKFPEYTSYKIKTKMLIPFLF